MLQNAPESLAVVDWYSRRSPDTPIGIIGWGEGGLIALYAAAVDTRVDVACVSGYFDSRQNIWQEPIDFDEKQAPLIGCLDIFLEYNDNKFVLSLIMEKATSDLKVIIK